MHIYAPPDSRPLQEYTKIAQRVGLVGATNLLIGLSGLILIPILTKTMPIEEYGTYVQITVTIGLVPALAMLGLPYTMVRFLAGAKSREVIQEGYYSIMATTVATAGVVSIILFLFADPISSALFDGRVAVTQIVSIIVFLECINGLQFNYFRTFQQIKRHSALNFFKTILQLILVGVLVTAGYGIFGAAIGLLIANLVLFGIMGLLIISEIGLAKPEFVYLKEFFSFGLPTVPGNISSWIVNASDRYLIAVYLGAAYVGYYSPGYTLGNTISMFITPLTFMLPAALSKLFDEKNIEAVKTILTHSKKYYLMVGIPSVVGISMLSKPLLIMLSTPEIAEQSYLVASISALGALIFGIRAIDSQILILEKKTMITGKIWIMSAVLSIALNLLFIPHIGIIGAAMSTLVTYIMAYIIIGIITRGYLVITADVRIILKSILASAIMAIVLLYLNPSGFFDLALTIIVGALVYVGSIFLLKGFSMHEINLVKEMIRGDHNLR